MPNETPEPPDGLGPTGAALFRAVVDAFEIDAGAGEDVLLVAACFAWQRHLEAQAVLTAEGVVIESPQGAKAHPAVAVADRMAQLTGKLLRSLKVEGHPDEMVKLRGGGGRPAVVRGRKVA